MISDSRSRSNNQILNAFVLLWALIIFNVFGVISVTGSEEPNWDVTFIPSKIELIEDELQQIQLQFNTSTFYNTESLLRLQIIIQDPGIATVSPSTLNINTSDFEQNELYSTYFNISAVFLGYTQAKVHTEFNGSSLTSNELRVVVNRENSVLNQAFTYSIAILVPIIYINMGAALNLDIVKDTLKRPIGPLIGVSTQFILMPLLSYGIGKWLIEAPELQLGLFATGCSPGGGASNIWTLALGGNLDLSITMTTISTLSAFFMMPLWILTLGSTITSEDVDLSIPYSKIGTFAISLLVPLGIGILIQKFSPRIAKILVRILKPFAAFLIAFIIVFAIVTNFYLFKLFTWQIFISGLLLPSLGYILSGGLALCCRQSIPNVIAIAIETGVQNTGLSIFVLRFSLEQPAADLATVLPVAVAIMTPLLPSVALICQKAKRLCEGRRNNKLVNVESGSGIGIGGSGVTTIDDGVSIHSNDKKS